MAGCSIFGSKPRDVLSEKTMVRVITQMHLTEANLRVRNDSLVTVSDTLRLRQRFANVFIQEDITPDEFKRSIEYYVEHFDELDKIYTQVINNLTEQEAGLQRKPQKHASDTSRNQQGNANLPDSIRKRLNQKR